MTNNPTPENSFNRPTFTEDGKARALGKVTNRIASQKNKDFLEQQQEMATTKTDSYQELRIEEVELVQSRIDMDTEILSRDLGHQALTDIVIPEIPHVTDEEKMTSNEPTLLAEEVDLWPNIYTGEDLDKAWEKVVAERGNIEPSIKNLNAISIKPASPVPPPGIIESRLNEEGGLSAFQARHGYTEPPKERPTSKKQPVPEKDEDKVKTAERLQAANLWLERFKNTQLSVDNVLPAAEDGRFFTLEQIDQMGGLELLREDIEALKELTNPQKLAKEVKKIKTARSNKDSLEDESDNIDKIVDSVAIDFGSDVQAVAPIEPETTPEAPDTDL